MSTSSTFRNGALVVVVMLVLLLDAVGTLVDLPEPLLVVSLPCFPFILEQIDLKLKSSDLKLMMLKFRLTDFFD